MNDFEGRKVLITGATRGIGRAAAALFHAAGATVAINGRTREAVESVIGEFRRADWYPHPEIWPCPGSRHA